ncbi:MAG TPA: hypothetical protein DD640_05035 [Clostridiales bacterium]|nr:hypothetical protein [Clostridiales bacterium]
MELTYTATAADHGSRAVDVLIRRTGMSRLLSKKIRLYGQLTCNGMPFRMIDPVRAGDRLVAAYNPSPDCPPVLRDVPGVRILYQDDWLLVADKPAGMVTHPSYLHDTGSLTSLLADYPLHPVTRLDRDTSGVVLIARNGHAHYVLSCHPMEKQYLALVHGRFPAPDGLIQIPIRRAPDSIILREAGSPGADARTVWHELRYFHQSGVSMIRFTLLTGRTHQIRVHTLACSCPLVGDSLYGLAALKGGGYPAIQASCSQAAAEIDFLISRQSLHAYRLCFHHPVTGREQRVTAPVPEDFRRLLRHLLLRERANP